MTTLSDLTDNELAATLAHHKDEVRRLEAEVTRRQGEAEQAALAAYWLAHPELLPVAVGDKLLSISRGRVIIVHLLRDGLVYADGKGYNPEIASRMKKAYLESESTK